MNAAARDFRSWPIATKFSLGLDVSFWGVAEVGWAAAFAASVATRSGHSNDDSLTSKGKNFSTETPASFEDRCVHLGGEFFADKGLLYYSGFINFRQY